MRRTPAFCPCGRAARQNAAPRRLQPLAERRRCKWVKEAATWLLPQPKAAQECCRYDRTATEERRTTRTTLCNNGRAPRKNAPPCRLHPHSGAAAVQRGEKRIQGGSRGNSQSPYPSLAAGGSHKAAAAANSGARTRRKTFNATRTQSNKPAPLQQGGAPRQNAALCRLQPLSGAAAFQGVKENPRRQPQGCCRSHQRRKNTTHMRACLSPHPRQIQRELRARALAR